MWRTPVGRAVVVALLTVGLTRPAWAYPARFAHGVTVQTSLEIPPAGRLPPATVQVWTFAPGAELRHDNDSYDSYEQHLAVVTGSGWVTADGLGGRLVRPGAVLECAAGARLTITTDAALCLLAVSWDVDRDEDGRGVARRPDVRVVDEATAESHPQPTAAELTVAARVIMPGGITVEAWSIAAGGAVCCTAGNPEPATALRGPAVDQACFLVFEGTGRVNTDASARHPIGVGNRFGVTTPDTVQITADTTLRLVKIAGVW
jgi:quercetin dioxygenase-like cupin family protein